MTLPKVTKITCHTAVTACFHDKAGSS